MTPVGTPPNLILLGFLEANAIKAIPFIKWIMLTAPLALKDIKFNINKNEKIFLTSVQKRLLYILGSLVIFLFVNSRIEPYYSGLGLNEKGILLAYGFTKNWILRMGRYKTNSL